jgi:hypothetical protein
MNMMVNIRIPCLHTGSKEPYAVIAGPHNDGVIDLLNDGQFTGNNDMHDGVDHYSRVF